MIWTILEKWKLFTQTIWMIKELWFFLIKYFIFFLSSLPWEFFSKKTFKFQISFIVTVLLKHFKDESVSSEFPSNRDQILLTYKTKCVSKFSVKVSYSIKGSKKFKMRFADSMAKKSWLLCQDWLSSGSANCLWIKC